MAKAIKSGSIFVVLFIIFFLVISDVPKTEAQDHDECLKAYDANLQFCNPATTIWPSTCYSYCVGQKGAKSGKCEMFGDDAKCLCDYCNDTRVVTDVPETKAQGDECLKDYGGDGLGVCHPAPFVYPSICYRRCVWENGAKNGICQKVGDDVKCLCDYCNDNSPIYS